MRHGESVMAYVRGRRLELAAQQLRTSTNKSVVEIALDCCFDSHAAFTRAFRRAFGISPSAYRHLKDHSARRRRMTMKAPPMLEARIQHVETFYVAGMSGHFDPSTYVQIAELWKAFAARAQFSGRIGGGETCGVFRGRNAVTSSFEHLAGSRIESDKSPDGLEVWTVTGRDYLVFKHLLVDGDLHPQVAAAQAEIWARRVFESGRQLADAPDFQIYPANFKVCAGGWLEYYLPLA
jgi:AraC family transcriptional regulator